MQFGIYNTGLDPGGHAATRIVAFVADVAASGRISSLRFSPATCGHGWSR